MQSNLEDLTPRLASLEFSFAQLTTLLAAKFNYDISGTLRRDAVSGFDENAWDAEEPEYSPVVVDIEYDEEPMELDVDFSKRLKEGGHMDMKTGRMVFESHIGI